MGAGLLLLVLQILTALQVDVIQRDAASFWNMAQDLLAGDLSRFLSYFQHPLHPAGMALALFLGKGSWSAAVAWSLLNALLTLVPLYFLGKYLLTPQAWPWLGLLYALHPRGAWMASGVLTEPGYILWLTTALAAGWRVRDPARNNGGWLALLAGAGVGLAYLTRPEGLGLGGLLLLSLGCSRLSWPQKLSRSLLLAAGLILAAGWYPAWLSHQHGHFLLTLKQSGNVAVARGLDAWSGQLRDAAYLQQVDRQGGFWKTLAESSHPFLLILAGIGLLTRAGRDRRHGYWLLPALAYALLALFLLYSAGYLSRRHLYFTTFLTLFWSAEGAAASLAFFRRQGFPRLGIPARWAAPFLGILAAALLGGKALHLSSASSLGERRGGEALARRLPAASFLVTDTPRASFYAGFRYLDIDWALGKNWLLRNASRPGTWLLVRDENRPRLRPLLRDKRLLPRYRFRFLPGNPGREYPPLRFLVYRVAPPPHP